MIYKLSKETKKTINDYVNEQRQNKKYGNPYPPYSLENKYYDLLMNKHYKATLKKLDLMDKNLSFLSSISGVKYV